jgi:hypothetical protein
MLEDREAANSTGWSPEKHMSDEDHEYILWMANHIERELDDAFYDRNVNGDDSYLKELDERIRQAFSRRIFSEKIRNGTKAMPAGTRGEWH